MNAGQMKTKLRKRIGNPAVADVSDANLLEYLNDAFQEIRDKYAFLKGRGRAKFNTTIGVDKYKISSITDTLLRVWDRTNKRRLDKVGSTQATAMDFDGVTNGKPLQYARFEDYLQLYPPPDSVCSIELLYRSKYTALVNDSDSPDIPDTWHQGGVILAAFNYYDAEAKDAAKAVYEKSAFKDWLTDKPVEAAEEAATLDTGVEVPTLGGAVDRLDFDHSA